MTIENTRLCSFCVSLSIRLVSLASFTVLYGDDVSVFASKVTLTGPINPHAVRSCDNCSLSFFPTKNNKKGI